MFLVGVCVLFQAGVLLLGSSVAICAVSCAFHLYFMFNENRRSSFHKRRKRRKKPFGLLGYLISFFFFNCFFLQQFPFLIKNERASKQNFKLLYGMFELPIFCFLSVILDQDDKRERTKENGAKNERAQKLAMRKMRWCNVRGKKAKQVVSV